METTNFFFALSVLMVGINAVWIYKFYSMKRTYIKAGKCIVQLIEKVQKFRTENMDLQDSVNVLKEANILLRDMIPLENISPLQVKLNKRKTAKKKANTKIEQKTKQSKIKGK